MGRAFDPGEIWTLTFDCYGTLIDWRTGVREALAAIPSLRAADVARLVRDRERVEREIERGEYLPYGEVLARSLFAAAREQGIAVTEGEARLFADSQGAWPPFAESREALARLAERWQLAILSNVETRVLERSVRALGAPFELLVTAEDVRSYKPARAHFEAALARLGVGPERVLHVACSLYHDVRPAAAIGMRTAFVDREGEGTPPDLAPDVAAPDLRALVAALGA